MSATGAVADALVIIFAGIFLVVQPRYYRIGALKLFPESKRDLVADAMEHSRKALRLWLGAQLVSMVVVGVLTGAGLWLLGVPFAIALGLISALLEFIPFAGPTVAAFVGILVALMVSPELALYAAGVYFAVQQAEGLVIYPLLQQHSVDLPAALLLLALVAFALLFGVLGVVFAAPLTVVTYVLVKRLYVVEALQTPTPMPGSSEADE